MNTTLSAIALLASAALVLAADTQDTRVYELRIYHAAPGKLDDLNKRFRDHTLKIFEKHGMENIGYWMPAENPDNLLIYIIAHASRDAAKKSWAAFGADPDWKAAQKASEADGPLVKRGGVESYFMQATDYSPAIKPMKSGEPRVFELREYTAAEGKLGALDARFRDHTIKLFTKHGMNNVAYRPEGRGPQAHLHPLAQERGGREGVVRRLPPGPGMDQGEGRIRKQSRRPLDRRRDGRREIDLPARDRVFADEVRRRSGSSNFRAACPNGSKEWLHRH